MLLVPLNSLPVLVCAFHIPLISPLSLKHISYYGNKSMGTELSDIHTEGMLPRNLGIDWMVHQHCIWLGFYENPQEAAEGEEVSAEVTKKETPNPATGMFCSPMTFPVTQPCDSQGQKPEMGWPEPRDSGSLSGAAFLRESHKVTAAFMVSFNDVFQRTVSIS